MSVANCVPWYCFFVVPLFVLGFVVLPGCLGALIALFLVNYVPRHRKQVLVLVLLVLCGGLVLWLYRWIPASRDLLVSRDFLNDLLAEISLFGGPWMPAHWMAQGLQSAAKEEVGNMFSNLALVWS